MKIVITIIVILLALGLFGKLTTARYPCHWMQVGNSQVCQ